MFRRYTLKYAVTVRQDLTNKMYCILNQHQWGKSMKPIIMAMMVVLLIPAALAAQNYPAIDQAGMQKMMMQMQEVQKCMESVDQAELQAMEERATQFSKELEALCAAGKRSQAQKQALAFSREFAAKPAIQHMRKCGEMMQGSLPGMPTTFDEEEIANNHVCDQ